jgi:hypothetical protein
MTLKALWLSFGLAMAISCRPSPSSSLDNTTPSPQEADCDGYLIQPPCTDNSQCPGLCSDCPGFCLIPPGRSSGLCSDGSPGNQCNDDNKCAVGGRCYRQADSDWGVCTEGKFQNACLDPTYPCLSGLSCIMGFCSDGRPGSLCSSPDMCESSVCVNMETSNTPPISYGLCSSRRPGGVCTEQFSCPKGQVCLPSMVVSPESPSVTSSCFSEPGQNGGLCDTEGTCAPGLTCIRSYGDLPGRLTTQAVCSDGWEGSACSSYDNPCQTDQLGLALECKTTSPGVATNALSTCQSVTRGYLAAACQKPNNTCGSERGPSSPVINPTGFCTSSNQNAPCVSKAARYDNDICQYDSTCNNGLNCYVWSSRVLVSLDVDYQWSDLVNPSCVCGDGSVGMPCVVGSSDCRNGLKCEPIPQSHLELYGYCY